jgi:hypothetical protein
VATSQYVPGKQEIKHADIDYRINTATKKIYNSFNTYVVSSTPLQRAVWRTLLKGARAHETQFSVFITELDYFQYNLKQVTLSPCLNNHCAINT